MLHETVPLGCISGIRIGAHWSVLATIALFTWVLGTNLRGTDSTAVVWTVAIGGALALFASLAAHELAHSIVATRHGVRVERIVLWLLGGVSELSDEPRDARSDFRIAIAGPSTSLAIGVLAFGPALIAESAAPGGAIAGAFTWLAVTNIALAVFNLLPGAPLDGGRVLRAVIWWRTGDRLRAATVAARSGQVLGTALIILGIAEIIALGHLGGAWLMLLGWFLQTAAHAELTVAGMRHRLGGTRVRDVMTSHPMAVPAHWLVAQLLDSDALDTGHRVFPVIDTHGHPVAVLAWSDLAAVPKSARPTTPIRAVARGLPSGTIVGPDELLADAATRVVLRPKLDALTVVDASRRLIGIVTATDLTTACDRSALGLPVPKAHPSNAIHPSADRGTS
ncbi:site-2 protease family protein [Nocardia mexicana]|uniref:Zinc metalloprotease n=1 Tax=Nocardia mexicana TaxID=279262 RepID=A0A370HEV8_9NOCA|nr:site-2 protease family protein [Nocardia mexicana]RDI55240.1 Zn-dependent protease [Nocardia mexicana]